MMKKETLKITVCTGTTCYVLGGSHYLMLKQELPGEILARISLEGSPCMGDLPGTGRPKENALPKNWGDSFFRPRPG